LTAIQKANNNQMPVIDNDALKQAVEKGDGIPVPVYERGAQNGMVVDNEAATNNGATATP